MKLHLHPASGYSQKVITAFYEKGVAFTPIVVDMFDPVAKAEYAKLAPFGKVPLAIRDDGWKLPESSIIIEYLDTHYDQGTRLIPADRDLARQTRFQDRVADSYLMEPLVKILSNNFRPEGQRDPAGVTQALSVLDTTYALLEEHFAKKTWAIGDVFTMADCAYAPALGYLRKVRPFASFANLTAYARRVFERPSFRRVLEEAEPYLAKLPL